MHNQGNEFIIRRAIIEDLPAIVRMLADDELGQTREDISTPLNQNYLSAFETIDKNSQCELLVVEYQENIIGTAQVDYLTCISYQGACRAQIENVRIDKNYRSQGLGQKFISAIIDKARNHGCHFVQLTTNKQRHAAKRFYEKLGFKASHEGMKLVL